MSRAISRRSARAAPRPRPRAPISSIYSELNVCGYPPEDLVLKPAFQEACESAVTKLAAETADGGPALLVGSPWREDGKLYNAAVLLDQGRVAAARYKCDLPNYGVFDEKRVFTPSPPQGPVNFRNVRLGVMVCEDMWYSTVTECLAETGAEILMLGNGSPYEHEKQEERIQLAVQRVKKSSLPIIYVNQVGGQDELVFDGASFVVDGDYSLKAQLPAFTDKVSLTRWQRQGDHWRCVAGELTKPLDGLPSIYAAMTLGLRDYVEKNRFPGVLLGLIRRYRFRDHGGGGGGCAGSGSRLGGHDAIALHQPGEPGRRGGSGAAAGHPPGHRLH